MSFGKIFESTYTGSMVGSGPVVFAVWGYVIANTRPPGVVEINPIILAAMLGSTTESVQNALDFLQAEDARSRSKECGGRRLVGIGEFIYSVPTWQRYREARNDDERKEYMRDYMREYRLKIKETDVVKQCVNSSKPQLAKAEAEAEAEAEAKKEGREAHPTPPRQLSDILPTGAAQDMLALQSRIQGLRKEWKLALTYEEQKSMLANGACLYSLEDADWARLKAYLAAKVPEGAGYWQPRNRGQFVTNLPDVHGHACRWEEKQGLAPKKKGWA